MAGPAPPAARRRFAAAPASARFPVRRFVVLGARRGFSRSTAAWARPAAYGDLNAAVLALLALAALKSRLELPMVWLFNVWGSADLLYAFYQGNRVGLEPGQL